MPGEQSSTLGNTVLRLHGSVEMVRRINAFDWGATSLGPIDGWPQSLRTALSILLGSRFPMQILWGADYVHLYNDAYLPIAADKHPEALGRPGAQIWPEVWGTVAPMLDQVRATGEATWSNDQLLMLDRHGALEEGYFTFSYSPIEDDNGTIGGVFVAVTETTRRVIGARRLQIMRDLGVALAGITHAAEVGRAAAEVLARAAADLPFVLLYLAGDRQRLALAAATHVCAGHPAAPAIVAPADSRAPWPLAEALATLQPVLVNPLPAACGALPASPWSQPAGAAMVLPLLPAHSALPVGVLVAGLSPHLPLDDEYSAFLGQVAAQLAAGVGAAQAHAASQAALRVRDDFLSIAAHELKNPLTPIIGRLQLLQRRLVRENAAAQHLQSIEIVISEAHRLTEMVNALLDVSRLRSGQLGIQRAPLDLGALARRLAGEIQPTLESHSLALDLPSHPIEIDGDELRLEQVLRNLLGNAVKYSPSGGTITLSLTQAPDRALLAVTDQGLGIAPEALPHLFERYYRSDEPTARAIGGMGVGLFVVNEIVQLHGGTIEVASALGAGSTFTVALPLAGLPETPESSRSDHPAG